MPIVGKACRNNRKCLAQWSNNSNFQSAEMNPPIQNILPLVQLRFLKHECLLIQYTNAS
jgi:hypothetical protein